MLRRVVENHKMIQMFLVLVIKSLVLQLALAKPQGSPNGFPSCNVTEEKSQAVKPCILPFKINDQIFYSCTNYEDKDKKYWCSTNLDNKGHHIGDMGFWGYCPDDCLSPPESPATTTLPTTVTTTLPTTTTPATSTQPTIILSASDELKKALANIVGGKNNVLNLSQNMCRDIRCIKGLKASFCGFLRT